MMPIGDSTLDLDGDVEDVEDGFIEIQIGLKWNFCDAKWKNPNLFYSSMPIEFFGNARGPN